VLLFGGYDGDFDGETWVYDLSENTWTQKFPSASPSVRYSHALASLEGDQVLLFGGNQWDEYVNDTWVYGDIGDSTPPEAIADLSIALENGSKSSTGNIYLWWSEPYDDVGVSRYVVYRSIAQSAVGDSLAGTTDTSYTDMGAAGDTLTNYFYVVMAVDAAGNKSEPSNQVGEFDRRLLNGLKVTTATNTSKLT
jgi:hypothetical protein